MFSRRSFRQSFLPVVAAFAAIGCLTMATPSLAAEGGGATRPPGKRLGLGLHLGWPVGLAGKYTLTTGQAVQFGIGVGGHSWLGANVDYIFTPVSIPVSDVGSLGFYLGGGLFGGFGVAPGLKLGDSFFSGLPVVLGAEVPIGVVWNFQQLPVDIFLEVAPGLAILPGPNFSGRGAVGFRFFFF